MLRPLLLTTLTVCLLSPTLVWAQPNGGITGALEGDGAPSFYRPGRITRLVRTLTADGELSKADLLRAFARAGNRVNPREMAELRAALAGQFPGDTATFEVSDEAKRAAVDLFYTANLFDASKEALADGKTYGGSALPDAVKQVVATAKLNGAATYDVTRTNSDGEGVYTDYPSVTPATENMAFSWTEVTPASLQADIAAVGTSLRVSGSRTVDSNSVATYTTMVGGTGSVSAAYDEVYHPVRGSNATAWRLLMQSLEYPEWLVRDFTVDDVRKARSRGGDRWSSNCAILSDGSIHCLPAIRRHSSSAGLILTNPALARSQQLMWNGHLRVRAGKVVYIGTSGRISRRAASGRERFLNPIPLLEAWGFEMADDLVVRSEHSTARYQVDHERAVLYAAAP